MPKIPRYRVPHSLGNRTCLADGHIDWLTGLEIRPMNPRQKMQRRQHIHLMPKTLEQLFTFFLTPAISCDRHFSDYDFWNEGWRPIWSYHKQNFRREVILNGVTQQQYAKKYRLKLRNAYIHFQQVGGHSLHALHWVWHRQQFHQQQVQTGITVEDYLRKYSLHGMNAARQLKRKPMTQFWLEHFDCYYNEFWPMGISVATYTNLFRLNASTARQYLFNFPKSLFDPFLLRPWL